MNSTRKGLLVIEIDVLARTVEYMSLAIAMTQQLPD